MATATICGEPKNLSIIDNGNNTVTISCTVGANGQNNTAAGVEIFVLWGDSSSVTDEVSSTNYNFTCKLFGAAGDTVTKTLSFAEWPQEAMAKFLDTSTYTGYIIFEARTISHDGSSQYSGLYSDAYGTRVQQGIPFIWYGKTIPPKIITPTAKGTETRAGTSFTVRWEGGTGGINNNISGYSITLTNITTGNKLTVETTKRYYTFTADNFVANNRYRFSIRTLGTVPGFDGLFTDSGFLDIKNIELLEDLTITAVSDNTCMSINNLTNNFYLDTGSGNVLKLFWNTPLLSNTVINFYSITGYYKKSDEINSTVMLFSESGDMNSFYITSDMLTEIIDSHFQIEVQINANSEFGVETGSFINLSICRASGMYVEVSEGYAQPIMKRAIAFARIPDQEDTVTKELLLDENGEVLTDEDGTYLVTGSGDQESINTTWKLMEDFYIKDSEGKWQKSDIRYEVLTDSNGEIITDGYGDPIYVL